MEDMVVVPLVVAVEVSVVVAAVEGMDPVVAAVMEAVEDTNPTSLLK